MNKPRTWQPPEWAPHQACWTAYPCSAELWQTDLKPAQDEFVAFCRAVAASEPVHVLVASDADEKHLAQQLAGLPVRFFRVPYGDIWLRDTAPLFMRNAEGARVAGCFRFNGWGNKYVLDGDAGLNLALAQAAGVPVVNFPFVIEGGSIETDGEGTCLTSKQCVLNPNRNPDMDQAAIEAALCGALGCEKVLWVSEGLVNDHTDGHIDTLARFVAPGVVACMVPAGDDDPNKRVLQQTLAELQAMVDAKGRRLRVIEVPSPGCVQNAEKFVLPASYLNFYIGNTRVVVPTYGTPNDAAAVAALAQAFPGRHVVGVHGRAILNGGGAFHCMTQHEPTP